jgi:hypothetical protein
MCRLLRQTTHHEADDAIRMPFRRRPNSLNLRPRGHRSRSSSASDQTNDEHRQNKKAKGKIKLRITTPLDQEAPAVAVNKSRCGPRIEHDETLRPEPLLAGG